MSKRKKILNSSRSPVCFLVDLGQGATYTATMHKPDKSLPYSKLTQEQRDVADAVKDGRNILLTGPAGTGKSALLGYLGKTFPEMDLCATTGVAAINIGGTTIHSWAGLGLCKDPAALIAQNLFHRRQTVQRIRNAKMLAIDEVSMMDGNTLNTFNEVMQIVRGNKKPFGGIQVLFIGDFLQLPPIGRDNKEVQFAFESNAWKNADIQVCELKKIIRQADGDFAELLSGIRKGDNSDATMRVLAARRTAEDETPHIVPVVLATHNNIADRVNAVELAKIKGEEKVFKAKDWSVDTRTAQKIDKECLAPQELKLKIGAQVMLLCNLDMESGLANGSLGTVVQMGKGGDEGGPVVKFVNGETRTISPHTWNFKSAEMEIGERAQLPLRVAYAISIHKSQGMTLDKIRVHLGDCFADGQAYVALSRAKTLDGVFIESLRRDSIRANKKAVEFYDLHTARQTPASALPGRGKALGEYEQFVQQEIGLKP